MRAWVFPDCPLNVVSPFPKNTRPSCSSGSTRGPFTSSDLTTTVGTPGCLGGSAGTFTTKAQKITGFVIVRGFLLLLFYIQHSYTAFPRCYLGLSQPTLDCQGFSGAAWGRSSLVSAGFAGQPSCYRDDLLGWRLRRSSSLVSIKSMRTELSSRWRAAP